MDDAQLSGAEAAFQTSALKLALGRPAHNWQFDIQRAVDPEELLNSSDGRYRPLVRYARKYV
jgi:hypothetical protein